MLNKLLLSYREMLKSGRLKYPLVAIGVIAFLIFCAPKPGGADSRPAKPDAPPAGTERAIFAGGCFWCMEPPFDKLDGVLSTTSGYTGGKEADPTYPLVSSGRTTHTEAVEIVFDPKKVSYEKLLEVYWVNVDPTVADRQFCDRGSQYRPEIFTVSPAQKKAALASLESIKATKPFPAPIVVPITDATRFYAAEDYHQDYYQKNPIRYKLYRGGCRRDARLIELWGVGGN